MSKRSRTVALTLMGAAFALSACREEQSDVTSFPDLASCRAQAEAGSLTFTAADCDAAFAQAEADYTETAPRYDALAVCEEEHGAGNCQEASNGSGGFSFMPLLAGFMIGQMLSGRGGFMSQPLVNTPNGRYATPGGTGITSNAGKGTMGAQAFQKAPTTLGQPAMSRADVASRGGFGSSGAARSSFGG
ncbi:DUF1190 domain-containing protein [Falsirhodobacter halotolerans]|uniref:DUF1190 domain-containing protein n=1 Tax=Falsirhodobacter halotolerans TaxID=1146892 RepID=UPI001FD3FCF1|nr:DUF1190 domain-containing protein [Falsirhodobacter halotolerans]MCJ8141160.1 DUF1190 domain-containing protein [Falsirhodobacter halotolerans]